MEYKYKENLDKNIFRGYDIRGVYPTNLDEDTYYTFGLGFGTHIKRMGKTKCIVGHDNRLSSDTLYEALKEGIYDNAIKAIEKMEEETGNAEKAVKQYASGSTFGYSFEIININ